MKYPWQQQRIAPEETIKNVYGMKGLYGLEHFIVHKIKEKQAKREIISWTIYKMCLILTVDAVLAFSVLYYYAVYVW